MDAKYKGFTVFLRLSREYHNSLCHMDTFDDIVFQQMALFTFSPAPIWSETERTEANKLENDLTLLLSTLTYCKSTLIKLV